MDREKFIQASATIRILEKKLLKKEQLNTLKEQKSLEDVLNNLNGTIYHETIVKLNSPKEYEKALQNEEIRFYKEVYSICPDREVVDFLALKYYYHNIKVLVKEYILGEDFSDHLIFTPGLDLDLFKKDIRDDNSKSSIELMRVFKGAVSIYEKNKNPQDIDIYIDREYFKNLIELAKKLKVDMIIKYAEDRIDFRNINTLLRCREQNKDERFIRTVLNKGGNLDIEGILDFLKGNLSEDNPFLRRSRIYKPVKRGITEYENNGSLTAFEKERDNHLIRTIKEAKTITYGPEVVFAYLYAKEMEIVNLRTIMIAKDNDLDDSFIDERLRDNYV